MCTEKLSPETLILATVGRRSDANLRTDSINTHGHATGDDDYFFFMVQYVPPCLTLHFGGGIFCYK